MTLPRVLSNQRETSTWHGSGPPQTYPSALKK